MDIAELVEKEFYKPNYLIENTCNKSNYTIIYFSSNGIFGDNDPVLFENEIIKKNKFEFYKTRIDKASKHIFLRDITLERYLNGINKELNSVEKVLEFLKHETIGTKIITVGSSAGGYAAALFGILLQAEYIFSFSGQYILPNYKESQYYNLTPLIKDNNIPIFYMLPSNVELDLLQLASVKNINSVQKLIIKSFVHGIPITKYTLKCIINSELPKLKKMYNGKIQSENAFMLHNFGVIQFLFKIVKKNVSCLIAKNLKRINHV